MKIRNGINPDFADFDEVDLDTAELIEEFGYGVYSFEELVGLLGREEAERLAAQLDAADEEHVDRLFDDPDDFFIDE